MRLLRYVCAALLVSLSVISCKDKATTDTDAVKKEKTSMLLNKRDTTQVLDLTKTFLEHLKAERIDSAMAMLYYLDKDGKVVPLPDSLAKKQRFVFKRFPVLSYKIDAVTFMSETDSQVKYTIEFFKKEPGDPRPNTTTFFIKPMRVDFKWYLTMFDSNTYNGGMTRIKN